MKTFHANNNFKDWQHKIKLIYLQNPPQQSSLSDYETKGFQIKESLEAMRNLRFKAMAKAGVRKQLIIPTEIGTS